METKHVNIIKCKFPNSPKNLWCDCQQQKNSYDQLSLWWEIEKMYLKLAIDYCVETKKKQKKKTRRTYTVSKYRENETKPRPKENKQITKSPTRYTKL